MRNEGTTPRETRALPRVAWLLVPLMGVFFLVYPVRELLATGPSPARTIFVFAGAALFVGIYLWFMWLHEPLQLVQAGSGAIHTYRAIIAFLAALAVAISLVGGDVWRMLIVYHVNVAAGIMLPRRDASVAIAGVAAITFAFGISIGLAWLAAPAVALGLWATAFVQQVATVAELREAREELAHLAVAEERLRFARDLHDLLGHSLSLITLKNELAIKLLPVTPERAAKEIREAVTVARGALRDVREAVAGYRQPTLAEELHGAVEMLDAAGIACRVENRAGPLPKPMDATLAWLVREGATNVIRHSRAHRCTIMLARDGGMICAEMRDGGRGSRASVGSAADAVGGSGLSGLAERVATIAGADFAAGPLPEGGFRLRVRVPLPQDITPRGEDERQ